MTSLSKGEVLGFTIILLEEFLPVVEIWKVPSARDLLQDNSVTVPWGVFSTPWREASNSVYPFFPLAIVISF